MESQAEKIASTSKGKRSCDNCRQRRTKCEKDSSSSPCKECYKRNVDCTYFVEPRKRGPVSKQSKDKTDNDVPFQNEILLSDFQVPLDSSPFTQGTLDYAKNFAESISYANLYNSTNFKLDLKNIDINIYNLYTCNNDNSHIDVCTQSTNSPDNNVSEEAIDNEKIVYFLTQLNVNLNLLNQFELDSLYSFPDAPSKMFLYNCIYALVEFYSSTDSKFIIFSNIAYQYLSQCPVPYFDQPYYLKQADIACGVRILNYINDIKG